MSHQDNRQLVLVACRYLRNGLRDMAERQEVSEILARFSHVLRGPLMALQGAVEVLTSGLKSESLERDKLLDICRDIENQVEDMAEQADLIEEAKAVAARETLKPRFASAPIVKLVDTVWQGMARRARLCEITLDGISRLRSLPNVEMDWNHMRVVFANLFHNAVKYSHSNEAIRIFGEEISVGGDAWVRLCVGDFGIGIHPDEIQEKVYLPNFRGSIRDEKRDIQGVGMGLTVCKEIVEDMHHGRLWARCEERGGTPRSYQHCWVEFYVELPIRQTKLPGGE